jgi:hypothetical protein
MTCSRTGIDTEVRASGLSQATGKARRGDEEHTEVLGRSRRGCVGHAGNFVIATVTPINSTNTWVSFESSIAPIAADGSAAFSVGFQPGDTLFSFVVAVAIQ